MVFSAFLTLMLNWYMYVGDYVCGRINKQVSRGMRVSVAAHRNDCGKASSHAITIDWALCCAARIHSYRKIDCSSMDEDNIFG